MMERTEAETVLNGRWPPMRVPAEVCGFEANAHPIYKGIKSADSTLIAVGVEHLIAKVWIPLEA